MRNGGARAFERTLRRSHSHRNGKTPEENVIVCLVFGDACAIRSFHRIAEGLHVFANSVVTRHNRHELRRLAERFDGRDVYRIERANGLHRKRASDAREDVVCDGDDIAATLKPPQRTNRRAFRVNRESFADTRPHDSARRFG